MSAVKRSFDLVVATLGLVCAMPLMAVIAAAIRISMGSPVLYRAPRVGQGGVEFTLYKFRSMRPEGGARVTAGSDQRVTRVGRLIRRTKLDELPQLLNIIRGDMSVVGPRPEDPEFVGLYSAAQREVLRFRPGVVSPAILAYLDEETVLAELCADGQSAGAAYAMHIMPVKIEADLDYFPSATFRSDLGLLLRCARLLITPRANHSVGV